MDVPVQVARRRLYAIASPEQPEALAAFDLDAKIITYRPPLPVIAAPFVMDSLGIMQLIDMQQEGRDFQLIRLPFHFKNKYSKFRKFLRDDNYNSAIFIVNFLPMLINGVAVINSLQISFGNRKPGDCSAL